MPRPTPDALNAPFRKACGPERGCAHPGCPEPGEYRAPVSRERLEEYLWFCLDHVRAYNQAWDYFAGLSEQEIELLRRADTVWQRPSWPLGRFGERLAAGMRYRVRDPFGFFAEDEAQPCAPQPRSEEEKALAVFDLKGPVTFEDVRARYMTLVKRLHPDANGGDRASEERLKTVNQAYAALKVSLA